MSSPQPPTPRRRVASIPYFHNADITQPTLVMLVWAAIAVGTVAIAWLGQSRRRPAGAQTSAVTSRAATRGPGSPPIASGVSGG